MTALQLIYNQPYGTAPCAGRSPRAGRGDPGAAPPLSVDGLWQAYRQLESSRVRGSGRRVTTDLVSLVRFAIERDAELTPFAERVNARFDAWLAGQQANGRTFSAQQHELLLMIRDHIAGSCTIEKEDLDEVPFSQNGGLARVYNLFGDGYKDLLNELNKALAA